jgi:hypothetical protein
MRDSIAEVYRVLDRGGRAVYVVGENTIRGTYIRNSVIVSKLAESAGFTEVQRRTRALPANRRYMPPPSTSEGSMDTRMRREVILTFAK